MKKLFLWIFFVGCIGLLIIYLGSESPDKRPQEQGATVKSQSIPNNMWYVDGHNRIGCPSKDTFEQAVKFSVEGDNHAFQKLMYNGECKRLDPVNPVYLEDIKILSGLVQIRPQGETESLWTIREAITHQEPQDVPPPRANDFATHMPTQIETKRLIENALKAMKQAENALTVASRNHDSRALQDSVERPLFTELKEWLPYAGNLGSAQSCYDAMFDLKCLAEYERKGDSWFIERFQGSYRDDIPKCQKAATDYGIAPQNFSQTGRPNTAVEVQRKTRPLPLFPLK